MKQVCITFDDGRLDNYIYALPILEKYGIRATFFITTGYIDGSFNPTTWKTSLGPMSVDNVIELHGLGHEIALHGDNHKTDVDDFNCCYDKMSEWLGKDQKYGFSIPGSHINVSDLEFFKEHTKNRIAYIRGGSQGGSSNRYIKRMQKGLRIYSGLNWIYNLYNKKNILLHIDADNLIPAIGVRKTDKVKQLVSFISYIPDNTTVSFMFHSIVSQNSAEYGADAWGWSKENFESFCKFLYDSRIENILNTQRMCDLIR